MAFGVNFNYQRNAISILENNDEINMDFGALFTPFRELGFGLMASSLLVVDEDDVPTEFQRPNYVALGATYFYQGQFQFRGDITTFTRGPASGELKYAIGVESSSHEYLRLRMGGVRDEFLKENSYMIGLGFDGPKLRVDYAYKKTTSQPQSQLHSVDLRLSF
ncbi:MAG: hypothetical protein R2827_01165 [Bdellovibrionales bacterium]